MTTGPIVVEQHFPVPREVVWCAVTMPALMRRWYFEPIEDFRAEVGFATSFEVASCGRIFRRLWEVIEVVPGRLLTTTWRCDGYPGQGTAEWKLVGTPTGARLVLIFSGIESFPRGIPKLTRESCRAGWEHFLRQRLPALLEREA